METISEGLVRGRLHVPADPWTAGVVLAHGAGSNAESPLLVGVANAFASRGVLALRINLPFRQQGRTGPPHPARAAHDREGISEAAAVLRGRGCETVFLGGHSYGGRQASMLAAENQCSVRALLLLGYPLHPPRKPDQMRTAHFASLVTPSLFVSGTRDPFGTPEELRTALPAHAELILIEGAGHELKPVVKNAASVVEAFLDYVSRVGD
ncbi:MAG TPA: alpha/beta fold hydrolase [Bryobacteraceae bacterium]|nr:alpha/beta fold hydrolase [Bryobacteraceae bacterium]